MSRRLAAVILGVAATAGFGSTQPPAGAPPLRFNWQAGQTLTYKVTQHTAVTETTLDEKTERPVTSVSQTDLQLTRVWAVKAVDQAGTATLAMSITALKNQIKQSDGNVIARDSANPEHAREMAEFLNKPIVVVRVDARGRLVEVKEAKAGSANRLHAELPFRVTLPDAGPVTGQTWDRAFSLKLDPPLGTGESREFVQQYTCKQVQNGVAVVGVETVLKAQPKTAGEQVPLVPMFWKGDVVFDTAAGRYRNARLSVAAELPNHLGEGTKFVYQSQYAEELVEK